MKQAHESIAVRERPIIFAAESVRAILNGSKTQTRRVIPWETDDVIFDGERDGQFVFSRFSYSVTARCETRIDCPFGRAGERLWVREAWCGGVGEGIDGRNAPGYVSYRADGEFTEYFKSQGRRWRSPIFMPRWASRLTLEIVSVRAQRLQEISPDDCFKEGLRDPDGRLGWAPSAAVLAFAEAWDKIDGKKHPWKSNCWVWAIAFRRHGDAGVVIGDDDLDEAIAEIERRKQSEIIDP